MAYGSSDVINDCEEEVRHLKQMLVEADIRYTVMLGWWEAAEKENKELKDKLINLWGQG